MKQYDSVIRDGKLARLSVSQLSRFDERERGGCQRKWWFRYVDKREDPPSEAQKDGTEGHKRLEKYFLGDDNALSPMELPALQVLPPRGEHVYPEVDLQHLKLLDIPFQGAMDLVDLSGKGAFDYKFQATPKKFLAPTVQMWGYLEELRLRFDERFSFTFVGIVKKPPYKKPTVSPFEPSKQQVQDSWQEYAPVVREISQVALATRVDDVKANREACFAYGKCPYFDVCPQQSTEVIVSFMDKLTAMKADISNGVVSERIDERPAAVPLPDVGILPPDAPQASALDEAPDSSPSSAPKKKRQAPVASTPQKVTIRFAYKVNLENVLGPSHKYESAETDITVEDSSGTDVDELASKIQGSVVRQLDAFVASRKK